jgi:hypothetical protein
MSHLQVRLLAKSYPHKFRLALKLDVLDVIKRIQGTKTGLKSANKTPLMSEVTVNNKFKLGICFKKAAQSYFFPNLMA